jgi:serine phosphatase RsbU (regulator of sigma subunit)
MRKTLIILLIIKFSTIISQSDRLGIDSLEKILLTTQDQTKIIETKSSLFINLFLSGQDKKALKHYAEALEVALKLNNKKGLISLYNNYGTYQYNKNEFDSSLHYYMLTNKIATEINDKNYMLKSISNIASIQFMKGDYKGALNNYNKGLKLEEELGFMEGSIISINNIGFIYNALSMNDKAHQYFMKGEKIYSKSDKLSSLVYSYDGLSITYSHMKKYDSAIFYGKKSLELGRKLNDLYTVGYSLDNLGSLHRNIKKNSEALEYFKEATTVYEKINDFRLGMTIYANLSQLYLNLKDTLNANKCLEKMMQFEGKFKISLDQRSFYPYFAAIAYNKKEYKTAYDYLKTYINLKDSSYTLEVAQQINEINTKYQTDKKEKENIILQKENEKRLQEISVQKTTRNYLLAIIILGILMFIGAIAMFRKINRINAELSVKNKDIENKNHTLTEQKKEILDSIHYAKRIQQTLLAHTDFVNEHLPQNFILFKPKDIVSGDFYWATKAISAEGHELFYFAVCDSTGHGVPGAFMSLLNIGFLSEAINEKGITEPGEIFNFVRNRLINSISKEGQKDGFDGILICLNKTTNTLTYSAANNAPVLIKNNEILSLPYDKMPVGIGLKQDDFETHTIDISKHDTLYLYSDGYADQFGGPKGKKFMYKKLNLLLAEIAIKPLHEQKQILEDTFEKWRGNLEQVDDVAFIGIRI